MQNIPISSADRALLGKAYDELMLAKGKKPPKDPNEALKYEIAKELFINEQALQKMKQNPALKDLLNKGSLMPPSAPQAPAQDNSSAFASAANIPPAKPPLVQLIEAVKQAQQLPQWQRDQQKPSIFASPTGQPSVAGALLKDRFQSTPLAPQAPAAAPVAAAPKATGMAPVAAAAPAAPAMPRAPGMAAQQSGPRNPAVDASYLQRMQQLIEQGITKPQEQAEMGKLEALKRAQAEYNTATSGGESALDFYRKSMEGIKRPERKDAKLSDEDRNDMLMRFGLGMLKNNRRGFGEAFGTAGGEAIDFGDRAKERKFNDALEVYRDAMARLSTEVNLSQKDKDALRERAATSYAQAKEIAGAEAGVALSGTTGAKMNAEALAQQYIESEKARREEMQNATTRYAADRAASTAATKAVPTEGLTAEGYARLSTQARKQAEDLRNTLPKKDDPRYNALASQIQQLEKQANMYWTASTRAAGGR